VRDKEAESAAIGRSRKGASSTTPPERNMIAQAALAFPWPGL